MLSIRKDSMSESKITSKLEKLSKLLTKIDEAHIINSDDSETWDSGALYNLAENLKEALKLLKDKEDPKNRDGFGQPIILEEGLCSLVDEYHEKKGKIKTDD